MLTIGLIGTGRMGHVRIRNILDCPETQLAWICSREENRARIFLKEIEDEGYDLGRPDIFTDWKTAPQKTETDAVVITSPNALHHEQALYFIGLGKHVFLEYPHAVTASQGDRIIKAHEDNGKVVEVGLTHRFNPMYKHLKSVYFCPGGGRLGLLYSYQRIMCSGKPISRWFDDEQLSGGMFVASMYHFLDEINGLVGPFEDYTAYYTIKKTESSKINQDCASFTAQNWLGAQIQIMYARGFPKPGLDPKYVMVFEGGYIQHSNDGMWEYTPQGKTRINPQDPKRGVFAKWESDKDRTNEHCEKEMKETPSQAEYEHFIRNCLQNNNAGWTLREAQKSLNMATRIQTEVNNTRVSL